MIGLTEPAAVRVIGAFEHLLGVGPTHRVGGADGGFVARTEPIYMVAGLLPVHPLLEDGRPLADLENVHHRIGIEQIFTAADRTASDVAGNLDDSFHLGRLLERRGVDRVTALVDVEGLLLAAHRFGGNRFGHLGRGGQIALMPEALDVGASGVGDCLDAIVVGAADERVETFHQVASGLVEGSLGQVLDQRIEALGGGEGELVFSNRRNRDPAAGERAQQIPQVEIGLLLHRRGDIAGLAVEFVDGDDSALGDVIRQRLSTGIHSLERQNPFFALGGGFAGGRVDQAGVLGVTVTVFQQFDINVFRSTGGGRVIGQRCAIHLFDMTVDVDHAGSQGQDIGDRAHFQPGQDRAFVEQDVGDLAPLLVDEILLLVEFGIQQVAVLVVADALVVLGQVECLA